MTPDDPALGRRSASASASAGVVWSSTAQGIRLAAQIAGLVILARLLPASDFGIIAMALVFTGIAALFRDFGTTAVIIQRENLGSALIDSIFWFNLTVGVLLGALIALSAPLVAHFFSSPRLSPVLSLLALAVPLGATGLVHQSLLERSSNFRPVALVESVAVLCGLASAVAAAIAGWGVYSLVAQHLVVAATTSVGLWSISSWRPTGRASLQELRGVWKFSGNLVGYSIFNYATRNLDNVLIGRVLGSAELGFYSIAYKLMLWPMQNVSSVVSRGLFPVFSRMQTESGRLGAAYLRATQAVLLVTAPFMMGLFVVRDLAVRTVLGEQWAPVADVLTWLVPIGLLQTAVAPAGPLYLSTGRTDLLFRWGILAGLVTSTAFFIGIQWGLDGLLIGYAAAMAILFFPSLLIPFRIVHLRIAQFWRAIAPPVLSALAMAALVTGIDVWLAGTAVSPSQRLSILVGAGAVAYCALSFVLQGRVLRDIAGTLRAR